jgi:hypothetical protein
MTGSLLGVATALCKRGRGACFSRRSNSVFTLWSVGDLLFGVQLLSAKRRYLTAQN